MAATAKTKKKAAVPKATATTKRTNGKTTAPASTPGNGRSGRPAAVPDVLNRTGRPRLGKGGLEALVVEHLRAHPKAEFTPSELGNKLTRSGGAIANALERLVEAGRAVRTSDRPRRYRHRATVARAGRR